MPEDPMQVGLDPGMTPLDLGEAMAPVVTPPAPKTPRETMKQWAPLLALLPVALARGGQRGGAALLSGYTQSADARAAAARQAELDAQTQADRQLTRQYQSGVLAQRAQNDAAQRRQQFMKAFQDGFADIEDAAHGQHYVALMSQLGSQLGIRPEVLTAFAQDKLNPTDLQQKTARRIVSAAKASYGEQAENNSYTVPWSQTPVSWKELNLMTGVSLGPPVEKPETVRYQSKDFILDGRRVAGSYDPANDRYRYLGQDVTDRVQPILPASERSRNEAPSPEEETLAQMLLDGRATPATLSKRGQSYNRIIALADDMSVEQTGKAYNPSKALLDYSAAQRFVATMNSGQMIRFHALANTVVNTIDEVRALGEELKQGGIQKWNRVKRNTVQQLYGNTPQSELANRYLGAVNTLTEEFANLAQGGYAPTEAAWKLANAQINSDFGFQDLEASLAEVQRLINFRIKAFEEQAPRLLGTPGAPAAPAAPGSREFGNDPTIIDLGGGLRVRPRR